MKHAKKLLCLALALVMSLSLVACSSSGDGKDDGSSPSAGIIATAPALREEISASGIFR